MAEPDNNQMAFWEAMKEKYERRNECLKQQEVCLRRRLEQLQQIMEKQKTGDDCDCVPEKLEKPSLVQCLVEKGRSLILGSCKCGDPKVGEELLCACHIQDSKSSLHIGPNLCPMQEPSPPDGCLNPTCDFYDPTLAHLAENPSTFSLKTTDMYYMDKLADLVKAEKNMQEKIDDLEKREHSYLTGIHDMQEAMRKQIRTDPINREFKKLHEGLQEENKKLKNEIEDIRLELKHCFERIEGPLRRSLENQQGKCTKLEKQLEDLQAKTKFKEDSYLREINEVKAKLCQACCTMVDLNSVNSKLKDDLGSLQINCMNLEDELLRQQLREAENILKFKSALSRRSPKKRIKDKGDDSEQDLGHIAKKLGDTLKEICPCVTDVPSGLTETAENIRQLTELVGEKGAQQRKKRKGKIRQIATTSCSDESDIREPVTSPKSQTKIKEADECACSNSSLRLKPKIGKNYSKNSEEAQIGGSSSFSLVTKPRLNMKATKQTCTPKTGTVAKKTVSKGCTCCPAQNECDHPPLNISKESIETLCSCSDVDTKKTGPSEEVIAVKNLGTLSIPTGKTLIQAEVENEPLSSEMTKIKDEHDTKLRRKKLAVDTTCDVLDESPKDIHVVTTLANTGSLEITTEGPPGIIETKVNYLPDGKIEIVTKLINRHNMESFLDGTLLHIPDGAPDYDKSQPDSDQRDEKSMASDIGCPEMDCNHSKTCEGQCENEVVEAAVQEDDINQLNLVNKGEIAMDGNVDKPFHGRFRVNNNFILPVDVNTFMTREWKNIQFQDDSREEAALQEMALLVKPIGKRQEMTPVHTDVTREEEVFRLSSRQSLTDVEDNIMKSSRSLVFPDMLDTIIEGDEDHSESNNYDKHSDVVKGAEIEENSSSVNSSEECIAQADPPEVAHETGNRSEAFILIKKEEVLEIKPRESLSILILKDAGIGRTLTQTETVKDLNSTKDTIHLKSEVFLRGKNLNCREELSLETKMASRGSLTSFRSTTPVDGVSENYSEWTVCESFFKLSRNINSFNGKITLKESKSMYEKRGSGSDYLRICKSATLSMGSLKIDLERLKLWRKIPNVGDSSASRLDDRDRVLVETSYLGPKPVDGGKGLPCLETDENIALDALKEGYNSIPKHTYQCFICSCSNQKNKNEDQQKKNVQSTQNNQDLADRIDRLLEIDPLAECQCIDCLLHKVPRDNEKVFRSECKCLKKQYDKDSCRCSLDEDKPIPKFEGPKQQSDNLQHDENCTCVDCICNPCHFKKDIVDNYPTSIMGSEMNKQPQEITVMKLSIPCDCIGKCSCSPCMDESKISKRPTEEILDAQTEGPKKPEITVGSSRIETESQMGSHDQRNSLPENCDDLSLCDIKNDVPKKDTVYLPSSVNCSCQLCECLFCSDQNARTKSAVKPLTVMAEHIIEEDKSNALKDIPPSSQPEVCMCAKCMCDPCVILAGQMRDADGHKPKVLHRDETTEEKQTLTSDKIVSCECGISCECVNCMGKLNSFDENNRGDNSGEKVITHMNSSEKGEKHKCPCSINLNTNEPVECDDCFICCRADISGKPMDNEVEGTRMIPCDCYKPCSCYPCPDPNMKSDNETLMVGDAHRAKEEIKSVLNKIGCSCDQAEDNLKPLVKQASNFETTISRMKMKLNNLQQKCKDKDQIINAMTDELRMRSQSGIFEDLLHDLAHPKEKFTPDYTRTRVCELLPKPRHKVGIKQQLKRSPLYRFNNSLEPILELDRYISGNEHDTYGYTKNLDVSGMEIIDIRRVTIDSILIKWRSPPCVNGVTGYQIFVNDELKYRVLSPNRTNAVIDSLDLGSSLEIMLFAITSYGRCEPPALATYKI